MVDAVKYDEITYMDILKQGLKVMDLTAVSLCKDNNLPMIIFNMNHPGNIKRVVMGEKVGAACVVGCGGKGQGVRDQGVRE